MDTKQREAINGLARKFLDDAKIVPGSSIEEVVEKIIQLLEAIEENNK